MAKLKEVKTKVIEIFNSIFTTDTDYFAKLKNDEIFKL